MIMDYSNSMLVESLAEDPVARSKSDMGYHAAFIVAVEEGLASSEQEDITLEEMEKEFYSWFTE